MLLDLRALAFHGYEPDEENRLRNVRFSAASTEDLLGGGEVRVVSAEELGAIEGAAFAPFRLEERWGCLVVDAPDDEDGFSEQRLRLLAGLSHQAKLAFRLLGYAS